VGCYEIPLPNSEAPDIIAQPRDTDAQSRTVNASVPNLIALTRNLNARSQTDNASASDLNAPSLTVNAAAPTVNAAASDLISQPLNLNAVLPDLVERAFNVRLKYAECFDPKANEGRPTFCPPEFVNTPG
jgi:hypothetical protein